MEECPPSPQLIQKRKRKPKEKKIKGSVNLMDLMQPFSIRITIHLPRFLEGTRITGVVEWNM